MKIAYVGAIILTSFSVPANAGDCGALVGAGAYSACETVRVKGVTKAVAFNQKRKGQVDLLIFTVRAGALGPKPDLHMKGIGQDLVPLRAAGKNGVVYRKQNLLFRDVTGDKSPELIFRVKNGRHADLYVLDLRRTDHAPELQFLEVAQLQNPDGGNARNFFIHDAAQDVVVLEDGSIGAAASDPFLGLDQRFMAFASYKNGRMGIEYIERTAFHKRLKGVSYAERASKKKKSKKTAASAAKKSNKRI